MSLLVETRISDSPYIETIMHGHTVSNGSTIRPAENSWHMVFVRHPGSWHPIIAGPLTTSGVAAWGEGAEILWVKFKLGVFMPHLPFEKLIDCETILPDAADNSFWLKSSTWQIPTFENVETFVARLAHEELLVCDPLVQAVLQDQPHDLSERSVRHHFLRATGLSQNHFRQVVRAQQAVTLLQQGASILDTAFELGYYDQPHLTRALRQWVGYTPAQLIEQHKPQTEAQIQKVERNKA